MADKRELLQQSLQRLQKGVDLHAPDVIVGHFAISVAVRAFGLTSSMQLAKHIVKYNQATVDYGTKLLDPESYESLELAEITQMMSDYDFDEAALNAAT